MAAGDNYISCVLKDLTPEALASAMLTKNTDGEIAIRVVFIDADATDGVECGIPLNKESAHKATIGLSEGSKPALRLALPKGSFLNNIATYADDAAAAVGGLAVGDIYFNSTTSKLHSRMS